MENTELAAEIVEMRRVDQEARKRWEADFKNRDLTTAVMNVDSANTARMREIVAEHGWPGSSLVGADAASGAWILVQHADRDRPFQKECLKLMQALGPGEVSASDVAYLVDRVRAGDGEPQVYGTQFWLDEAGVFGPRPIEDEANVDARRASVGLGSLAEYRKVMEDLYQEKG